MATPAEKVMTEQQHAIGGEKLIISDLDFSYGGNLPIYTGLTPSTGPNLLGRQVDDAKVWTSAMFITFSNG